MVGIPGTNSFVTIRRRNTTYLYIRVSLENQSAISKRNKAEAGEGRNLGHVEHAGPCNEGIVESEDTFCRVEDVGRETMHCLEQCVLFSDASIIFRNGKKASGQ